MSDAHNLSTSFLHHHLTCPLPSSLPVSIPKLQLEALCHQRLFTCSRDQPSKLMRHRLPPALVPPPLPSCMCLPISSLSLHEGLIHMENPILASELSLKAVSLGKSLRSPCGTELPPCCHVIWLPCDNVTWFLTPLLSAVPAEKFFDHFWDYLIFCPSLSGMKWGLLILWPTTPCQRICA